MQLLSGKTLAAALTVFVLSCTLAAQAAAQGFYFKEIRRDDRIYVFNDATRADLFEKTGEMGTGITKPGVGPKGETVVGDSERALQLFFFKYGISEAVPEPPQPVQRIEWRDGKTRITTDNAYLEISNRVQVRYTHEFPESNVRLPGTPSAGDERGSFRLRRAKFKLEGWFWRQNNLTYELQLNWPAASTNAGVATVAGATLPGANPGAFLEDANIAWDPKGRGSFRILFGQFKVAGGRQQLTSSGNQQFVDRSNVSDEYWRGRDTGVAIQGVLFSNKFEYRVGMSNGATAIPGGTLTRPNNDNDSFAYNARLMWQPNGNQALVQRAWVSGALYSEADFESTTVPLYAVALNLEANSAFRTTDGVDSRTLVAAVDGIFKFKGLSATGEYIWRQRETEPVTDVISHSNGWYFQAGKMLNRPRTWEVAARIGEREVSSLVDNDDITEMRVGLNYYYRRHNLKFQVDAGQLETGLGTTPGLRKDRELRIQTQFIF